MAKEDGCGEGGKNGEEMVIEEAVMEFPVQSPF
jgi:hypothetical protein